MEGSILRNLWKRKFSSTKSTFLFLKVSCWYKLAYLHCFYIQIEHCMKASLATLFFLCAFAICLPAQTIHNLVEQYLLNHQSELQIDLVTARSGWIISDYYQSPNDPIAHAYVQQAVHGIPVYNAISSVAVKNNQIAVFNSGFLPPVQSQPNALPGTEKVLLQDAIRMASLHKGIETGALATLPSPENKLRISQFSAANLANGPIRVQEVYFNQNQALRLAWQVEIPHKSDWWVMLIDALTGDVLFTGNYTVYCAFHPTEQGNFIGKSAVAPAENLGAAQYRVVPLPGESPNHVPFGKLSNPADPIASPFGWHDTNGLAGAEYTITRGNNVYAYEDRDADDQPGYSPDGGADLNFDFPFDPASQPLVNQDAAITNLFYVNNFMHDMTYHYGFDPSGGNFQSSNYGLGGLGGDYVNAEAQDGSGTNNANFSTPPDGINGRMQMYIWNSFTPSGIDKDCDFDNGVIAHEYGHGVSTRLTGGPQNSGCLFNAEQMGEGWSDYYTLITTVKAGDNRNTARSVGSYAQGQPASGLGIRNKLYTTDMSVNNYTYNSIKFGSQDPHNVGEIWTTMLWDLTWDLIDSLGFDPDPIAGHGGNNIAQHLITRGFQLQKCSPGFVDGRDAILQADALYYNGAYECMIWKAFARRGLGYSASQGSSDSALDGEEAFDVPPSCLVATQAPLAAFETDRKTSCLEAATFQFTDKSLYISQYLIWDFGDGTTSTERNPIHKYNAEGQYTVTLIVKNNIGEDTLIAHNYITVSKLAAPVVSDANVCANQTVTLTATPNDPQNNINWFDSNGKLLASGTSFTTPVLNADQAYQVQELSNLPVKKVGPTNIPQGGFSTANTVGKLYFTAFKPFVIHSVLVRALGAGPRTVQLFDQQDNVLQTYTINMPSGQSRVTMDIAVPGPGKYALGAGPNAKMFRSSADINYPYKLQGVVNLTGAGSGQENFYFFFYDWEVQEIACSSPLENVSVHVVPGPISQFNSVLNGLQATFNDLSIGNPVSWQWDFGDGSSSNEQNPVHVYNSLAVFTAALTVGDGTCTHTSYQTLDFTTATNNLLNANNLMRLQPNPSTGATQVQFANEVQLKRLEVWHSDGRLMRQFTPESGFTQVFDLNLIDLQTGMYWVKTYTDRGVFVGKFLIQ